MLFITKRDIYIDLRQAFTQLTIFLNLREFLKDKLYEFNKFKVRIN